LEELPEDVRTKMHFVLVERIDEALAVGLAPSKEQAPAEKLIA